MERMYTANEFLSFVSYRNEINEELSELSKRMGSVRYCLDAKLKDTVLNSVFRERELLFKQYEKRIPKELRDKEFFQLLFF